MVKSMVNVMLIGNKSVIINFHNCVAEEDA